MKVKNGYLLRKTAQENIVIYIGDDENEFNGMIQLNETGAFLWKLISEGKTHSEIIRAMMAYYDDLDEKIAQIDLNEFIESIKFAVVDD